MQLYSILRLWESLIECEHKEVLTLVKWVSNGLKIDKLIQFKALEMKDFRILDLWQCSNASGEMYIGAITKENMRSHQSRTHRARVESARNRKFDYSFRWLILNKSVNRKAPTVECDFFKLNGDNSDVPFCAMALTCLLIFFVKISYEELYQNENVPTTQIKARTKVQYLRVFEKNSFFAFGCTKFNGFVWPTTMRN